MAKNETNETPTPETPVPAPKKSASRAQPAKNGGVPRCYRHRVTSKMIGTGTQKTHCRRCGKPASEIQDEKTERCPATQQQPNSPNRGNIHERKEAFRQSRDRRERGGRNRGRIVEDDGEPAATV